ncbi:condensation domain-containing protein [Allorhizocola rhizosphaerae]|uniref:condensation domain-containing protein n=1 Tax=Allorhizocola rhizosphaerae TaxID=1872709 RepID=UPI0013C2AD6A|nr:condensation domain-containing protein [Allorhizocola rhizosphaerae]
MGSLSAAAAFTGPALPGTAPLTWGQRAYWLSAQRRGSSATLISMRRVMAMPRRAPSDVDSVLRAIGKLIERHSSLRTLIDFPRGRQEVVARGEQPVLVVPAELSDLDGTATAARLSEALAEQPFDHATELPQRVALVLTGERVVRQIVIVFSHTTVDFQATELVLRDLRLLLLRGAVPTPTGPQSADVGLAEQEEQSRRRGRRAVSYWVEGFRRLPVDTLPPVGPAEHPRWRRCVLVSSAADTALRLIARRHRVTSSTVLLSAVAGVLATWSGTDTCGIHTMVNNRALDRYQEAIAKINQLALVVVDLSGKPNFAEALPDVWHAAIAAYRHAYYDPAQMAAAFAEAGMPYATGVSPHCYFNDIRLVPTDTDLFGHDTTERAVREAMRHSTFTVGQGLEQFTWRLRIEVIDAPGGIGFALTGDTCHLPPPRAEQFLRAVEGLLVEAAFRAVPWPWAHA